MYLTNRILSQFFATDITIIIVIQFITWTIYYVPLAVSGPLITPFTEKL